MNNLITKPANYYNIIAHNLLYESELTQILGQFNQAGIDVIVLKGAFLARVVYQNLYERPMQDVDILVRPACLPKAVEMLEKLGFKNEPEPEDGPSPFRSVDTGEMKFLKPPGVVDLHWELISIEWLRHLFHFETEMVWENALPFEINGKSALHLDPPDLLMHLCFHLVAHNYAHPIGYQDISKVIIHYSPFPWETFLSRIKRIHMGPAVFFALEALHSQYPGIFPGEILDQLRPSALQQWIVSRIANPRQAMRGRVAYSHSRSYLLHLAVAGRLQDIFSLVAWLMFPGPKWLAMRYRLTSAPAAWFACFWHPFFVLSQGLKGMLTILKNR